MATDCPKALGLTVFSNVTLDEFSHEGKTKDFTWCQTTPQPQYLRLKLGVGDFKLLPYQPPYSRFLQYTVMDRSLIACSQSRRKDPDIVHASYRLSMPGQRLRRGIEFLFDRLQAATNYTNTRYHPVIV